MKELKVSESPISGLYVIDLPLYVDGRGWFKENYQKSKMEALGLPKFNAIQNNFSFNKETGATRGLHAEPWEKFISLANGKAFGAWVDLRGGNDFGKVFTAEINPETAFFIPRGVANAYQTLEPNVTYTYLVNEHWYPEAKYTALNLFDPELKINWPIPQSESTVSTKDTTNPLLKELEPLK